MKNEIYDNMLSAYDLSTEQQKRNAIFEVNQQVILAGLHNGGFFDVTSFYGDTCLRICHCRKGGSNNKKGQKEFREGRIGISERYHRCV